MLEDEEFKRKLLGAILSELRPEEVPAYQPVGDNGTWDDLEAPEGIDRGVVRASDELPEIVAKTPTDSERLRLEALWERKKLLRHVKNLEYLARKGKLKKVDGRKNRWARERTKKRQALLRREIRHKENRRKYWDMKLYLGEYHSAKLRAELNRVPWEIEEQEWEDSGIEDLIGNVREVRLKRIDTKLPWRLSNLIVLDKDVVIWHSQP